MADQPTVDQAVERAMRTQDAKIAAIRDLAQARQTLTDTQAEAARKLAELERENATTIGAAEREDLRLYTAAKKAGWTATELHAIGFTEPAKSRRATTRRARANGVRAARPAPGADAPTGASSDT